jgi:hypothetical protein
MRRGRRRRGRPRQPSLSLGSRHWQFKAGGPGSRHGRRGDETRACVRGTSLHIYCSTVAECLLTVTDSAVRWPAALSSSAVPIHSVCILYTNPLRALNVLCRTCVSRRRANGAKPCQSSPQTVSRGQSPRLRTDLAYTANHKVGARTSSALDFLEFDRMPAHRCERQPDLR